MPNNNESKLRRHAARNGLRLMKVRESSRDYHQYGPYAVADVQTNCLVAYGLDLDGVEDCLHS